MSSGAKSSKKVVFCVGTECPFSAENKCSFYSSQQAQQQAAKGRRKLWNRDYCPIVYVKTVGTSSQPSALLVAACLESKFQWLEVQAQLH